MLNLILSFALIFPALAFGFEPLNPDGAGIVKAGGNQPEQYYFSIQRHGSTNSSPINLVSPGEEFIGSGNAKAFPLTYTRGLSGTLEASIAAAYFNEPNGNFSKLSNVYLVLNGDSLQQSVVDMLLQLNLH